MLRRRDRSAGRPRLAGSTIRALGPAKGPLHLAQRAAVSGSLDSPSGDRIREPEPAARDLGKGFRRRDDHGVGPVCGAVAAVDLTATDSRMKDLVPDAKLEDRIDSLGPLGVEDRLHAKHG